jgi:hypothetical protein
VCAALLACQRDDVVAVVTSDGATSDDAGDCGAPLTFGASGSDDVCSGNVAERAFRFALCTCDGGDALVTTDSFAAAGTGRAGGSVGSNALLSASGTIGGSLWIGGGGVNAGSLRVLRDLADGGGVSGASLEVNGDARIGSDVSLTDFRVDGSLTLAEGATMSVSGTQQTPAPATGIVSVGQPCDCDPDELIDIDGLVLAHVDSATNDNASIGLADDALATAASLELPCGRFYQTAIGASAVGLHVTGRAALFVAGDVTPAGPFTIDLEPGAELDLFVAGALVSAETVAATRASGLRLYVDQAIQLSGGAELRANVYGRSQVEVSAPVVLYGSLFAKRLVSSASITVHYDESILEVGDACETPEACLGSCIDDSDCCAPLVCGPTGSCAPVID